MQPKTIKHYCQKCLAGNPLGQELCLRCGTRLMLIVEPPAARYEDSGLAATHEEHLLERVSALENRLTRLTEKLEQTLDLMLRQARSSYHDHALIDTLITVLAEAGALDAARLARLWRERCQQDTDEQETLARHEQLRRAVLLAYRGLEPSAFEQHVNAGFKLFNEKKSAEGLRELECAAALHPGNAELHAFLGERFFEAAKNTLAKDYLERALLANSANERVRLLFGLACGDAGEIERARELLKDSIRYAGASFAAHYGLGRLLVAEKKWAEAAKEFKQALLAGPSAEAHYALGCAYFQLNRDRTAVRHLRKAVELDADFGAAFYVLGLALLRSGEKAEGRAALSAACEGERDEPRYRSAARRVLRTNELPANPGIFGLKVDAAKGLITGGDRRLSAALRQAALRPVETPGSPEEALAR
jgi:tetratricopeptide (TPR) repeat protein